MWTPPLNRLGWHVSGTQWLIMIVFPLAWPILAVLLVAYLAYGAVWATLFLAGNAVLLVVMLVGVLVRASRRPGRPRHLPRRPA